MSEDMLGMSKHFVIVGGGLSGAVLARRLVDELSCRVTILEKKEHVGGHCHSERDETTGIMLHCYGPHIFNTNSDRAWQWMNRFSTMHAYINTVKAVSGGRVYSLPVNLHTMSQLFERVLTPTEARELLEADRVELGRPAENFEEQGLAILGPRLYRAFFEGYTRKQWGCDPKELPASIFRRLPVRFNFDDNYYETKWQGIPEEGYTGAISAMLEHEAIEVKRGVDFNAGMIDELGADFVFYTGPLDAFFDFKHGRLGYRSLRFERLDGVGDVQGGAIMNYSEAAVPWTRILEHKHLAPWEKHEKSVLFREYSFETGEIDNPFYPKRLKDDLVMLRKYLEEGTRLNKVAFLGRLATYRYLNMDKVIEEALLMADDFVLSETAGKSFAAFSKVVWEGEG